jgi:hypothetical protein
MTRVAKRVLATAAFALAGSAAVAQAPPQRVALQLKWHHQFQFAGYYAARDQGFYAAEGLDVEIVPGAPDRPPIARVLQGATEFGVGDSDVLLSRLRGQRGLRRHLPALPLRADEPLRQRDPDARGPDRAARDALGRPGREPDPGDAGARGDRPGAGRLRASVVVADGPDRPSHRRHVGVRHGRAGPAPRPGRGAGGAAQHRLRHRLLRGHAVHDRGAGARPPAAGRRVPPREPAGLGVRARPSEGAGAADPPDGGRGRPRRDPGHAAGRGRGDAAVHPARSGGDRAHEPRALAPHRRDLRRPGRGSFAGPARQAGLRARAGPRPGPAADGPRRRARRTGADRAGRAVERADPPPGPGPHPRAAAGRAGAAGERGAFPRGVRGRRHGHRGHDPGGPVRPGQRRLRRAFGLRPGGAGQPRADAVDPPRRSRRSPRTAREPAGRPAVALRRRAAAAAQGRGRGLGPGLGGAAARERRQSEALRVGHRRRDRPQARARAGESPGGAARQGAGRDPGDGPRGRRPLLERRRGPPLRPPGERGGRPPAVEPDRVARRGS